MAQQLNKRDSGYGSIGVPSVCLPFHSENVYLSQLHGTGFTQQEQVINPSAFFGYRAAPTDSVVDSTLGLDVPTPNGDFTGVSEYDLSINPPAEVTGGIGDHMQELDDIEMKAARSQSQQSSGYELYDPMNAVYSEPFSSRVYLQTSDQNMQITQVTNRLQRSGLDSDQISSIGSQSLCQGGPQSAQWMQSSHPDESRAAYNHFFGHDDFSAFQNPSQFTEASISNSRAHVPSQAEVFPQTPDQTLNFQEANYVSPRDKPNQRGTRRKPPSKPLKSRTKERAHSCSYAGCEQAFGTKNDLDRHTKSCHSSLIRGDRIWICQVPTCLQSQKVWPRRDNFKQHMTRMHHECPYSIDEMECQYDPNVHNAPEKSKRSVQARASQSLKSVVQEPSNLHCNPYNFDQGHAEALYDPAHDVHQSGMFMDSNANPERYPKAMVLSHLHPHVPGYGDAADLEPLNAEMSAHYPTVSNDVFPLHGHAVELQDTQTYQENVNVKDLDTISDTDPVLSRSSADMDRESAWNATRREFKLEDEEVPPEVKDKLISYFLSTKDKPRPSASAEGNNSPSSDRGDVCGYELENGKICDKTFNTGSELRKHRKRHNRRYGCTFDRCYLRFGTIWQWKRHEQGQHTQPEMWRCAIPIGKSQVVCGVIFSTKEDFEKHLITSHPRPSKKTIKTHVSKCHVAARWLGQYWCGFCGAIQTHSEKTGPGEEMVTARYKHITAHLAREIDPKDIHEDWFEFGQKGKTKGFMKRCDDEGSFKNEETR